MSKSIVKIKKKSITDKIKLLFDNSIGNSDENFKSLSEILDYIKPSQIANILDIFIDIKESSFDI